jgi:hypothetical protein
MGRRVSIRTVFSPIMHIAVGAFGLAQGLADFPASQGWTGRGLAAASALALAWGALQLAVELLRLFRRRSSGFRKAIVELLKAVAVATVVYSPLWAAILFAEAGVALGAAAVFVVVLSAFAWAVLDEERVAAAGERRQGNLFDRANWEATWEAERPFREAEARRRAAMTEAERREEDFERRIPMVAKVRGHML